MLLTQVTPHMILRGIMMHQMQVLVKNYLRLDENEK